MPAASGVELPMRGEDVIWYPQGKRIGEGNLCKVLAVNKMQGAVTIFKYMPTAGSGSNIVKDVPHISDERMNKPDAAKFRGAWEWSPLEQERRLLFKRTADLEARTPGALKAAIKEQ